MPNRRIVAIDLGTHCGYAIQETTGPPANGVLDLSPRQDEGGGMRFLRFLRWLQEIAPHEVWYEKVASHKGTRAAHVYGGLLGQLQAYCEELGVPYRGVSVGTIKKHATGKGNANKAAMIAAAKEKLDYVGDDDNEADALWLLDYVRTVGGAGPDA